MSPEERAALARLTEAIRRLADVLSDLGWRASRASDSLERAFRALET